MNAPVAGHAFDSSAADGYTSPAQRARVLTEEWVGRAGRCPACGGETLRANIAKNTATFDFVCSAPACAERFELKAQKIRDGRIRSRLTGAGWERLQTCYADETHPNYLFLFYDEAGAAVLLFVPREAMTLARFAPRPPLSAKARRKHWVGYILDLGTIPVDQVRVVFTRHEGWLARPLPLAAPQVALEQRTGSAADPLGIAALLPPASRQSRGPRSARLAVAATAAAAAAAAHSGIERVTHEYALRCSDGTRLNVRVAILDGRTVCETHHPTVGHRALLALPETGARLAAWHGGGGALTWRHRSSGTPLSTVTVAV